MLSEREEAALLLSKKDRLDAQYADNPWKFFCQQVKTIDESQTVDFQNKDRVYLWPREHVYLKETLTVLRNEPLVGIPKSRRMMVSWLLCAYFVHTARYFPNSAIFYMSETEQKSAFAVDRRCKFIEENLRGAEFRLPIKTVKTKSSLVGHMTYPNDSYIWALASGGDVLRQYTATMIFLDECEFQDEAPAVVRAALPMVENGSQLILASSSDGPIGVLADIADKCGIRSYRDVRGLVA